MQKYTFRSPKISVDLEYTTDGFSILMVNKYTNTTHEIKLEGKRLVHTYNGEVRSAFDLTEGKRDRLLQLVNRVRTTHDFLTVLGYVRKLAFYQQRKIDKFVQRFIEDMPEVYGVSSDDTKIIKDFLRYQLQKFLKGLVTP